VAALRPRFLDGVYPGTTAPSRVWDLDQTLERSTDTLYLLQWLLGHAHPEPWAWGEAYMRNAVGRLERLLAEAILP